MALQDRVFVGLILTFNRTFKTLSQIICFDVAETGQMFNMASCFQARGELSGGVAYYR
jgi:hypothetical protein